MYRGNETHFDSMNPRSMRAEHDSVRCHRGQNGVSDAIHQLRKRITTSGLDEANTSTLRAEADRVRASGVSIPSEGTLCVPSGTTEAGDHRGHERSAWGQTTGVCRPCRATP